MPSIISKQDACATVRLKKALMTREEIFWKEDIAADRDRLARIANQRGHERKTMVHIEKCVFVTFYAIRNRN